MIRRPPRSTHRGSSAASDVYKRQELNEINSFIKDGKKIILILNKIDLFNKNELKEIIENIKFKLPKDLNIPIIINNENNLKNYIAKLINQYGEILLTPKFYSIS